MDKINFSQKNEFIEFIICNVFHLEKNPKTIQKCFSFLKNFKKDIFGLFITIERNPKEYKLQEISDTYQKIEGNLNKIHSLKIKMQSEYKINQKRMIYPKERNFDIHGCKGYWDTNYQKLSEQKIMNEIEHIGESSTFHDSRKNNFKEEVQKDGNTIYKLSFMYLPIKEISSSSGKIINDGIIFNNKRYGLIYDSSLSRATYLPNVYPNESWSDIKSHLKKKGGSNSILENNVNDKFYAYKIFTIEDSIFSVLFSKSYISFLVSRIFSSFNILLEKSDFLPYIIDNDGKISIEKNQSVRNLATLNDFLKMKRFSFKGESIEDINNCINETIEFYIKEWKENRLSRQASSFLLLCLYELKREEEIQKKIEKDLYENIRSMEINFELGECLIALCFSPREKNELLLREGLEILMDNIVLSKERNLFRYNWISKYVYTLEFFKILKEDSILKKYRKELIIKIIDIIKENKETNQYAVTFEALSSLYGMGESKILKNYIWSQFLKLNEMYQEYRIKETKKEDQRSVFFYKFSDGKSRLDITGHILNGLFVYLDQ